MKKILISAVFLFSAGAVMSQQMVNYILYMRNISDKTMWDGTVLRVYGFAPNIGNVNVPGPTLECNEGDTLNVYAFNFSQGNPHTIHWHGMDVPQEVDGVHETSFHITHMMDTNLIFLAQRAGTYLYHCHVASVLHVQMGMYGSVIVHPADGSNTAWTNGPFYNSSRLWLMSEMDKMWHDSLPAVDTSHDMIMVMPYHPDYFLVNGYSQQQITADTNTAFSGMQYEKIYLRLSNIGYCMNRIVLPEAFNPIIRSTDGRPLPTPLPGDTIYIMPGERYEVMLQPDSQAVFQVPVEYLDVNTRNVLATETVPVTISGVIGREEPAAPQPTLSLWPNPAEDQLWVQWDHWARAEMQLSLCDLQGREVMQLTVPEWERNALLGVSGLETGMYVLTAQSGNRRISTQVAITH